MFADFRPLLDRAIALLSSGIHALIVSKDGVLDVYTLPALTKDAQLCAAISQRISSTSEVRWHTWLELLAEESRNNLSLMEHKRYLATDFGGPEEEIVVVCT